MGAIGVVPILFASTLSLRDVLCVFVTLCTAVRVFRAVGPAVLGRVVVHMRFAHLTFLVTESCEADVHGSHLLPVP